jgi:folate-binding protein YgfZ
MSPANHQDAYTAAREGAAAALLPERGVLAVTGPQRKKFLHGILSQDIEGRAAGEGSLAALMDVKGRLLALMRALVTADEVLLEMPADRLAVVEQALLHYRVAAPVRFAVRPAAVVAVLGPDARGVLAVAGCPVGDLPLQGHVSGRIAEWEARVQRAGDLPAGGFVVHVAPQGAAAVETALRAAGAEALPRQTLDALRVEEGRPWYGPDITEENLLHETGLVSEYHSATKGCYVGQEVIARLEGRGGHVNKRLRGLRLGAPAPAGAPVLVAGKDVGRVTTAATSPRLGPIAMGYVHRSQAEPGTAVEVGGFPAVVVTLPMSPP